MSFVGTSISAMGVTTACTKLLASGIGSVSTGAEKSRRDGMQRFWRGCHYRSRQRWTEVQAMRNPCKDCVYFNKENETCQSKKCATYGDGKVSWIDRLFCSPRKENDGGAEKR